MARLVRLCAGLPGEDACPTGATTGRGTSRCAGCEARFQSARNARRTHLLGDHRAEAELVRRDATRCHLCGEGPRYDDPWQADHLVAGDPASPKLPAHRSCNARRRDLTVAEYRRRFGVMR